MVRQTDTDDTIDLSPDADVDASIPDDPHSNVEDDDGVIPAGAVGFNPDAVLGAWEATEGVVPMVAAPVVNEFAKDDDGVNFYVDEWDGINEDHDAHFVDIEGYGGGLYCILVEEKAVGVVDRTADVPDGCRKIGLRHDEDRALYVNPAQIFVDRVEDKDAV